MRYKNFIRRLPYFTETPPDRDNLPEFESINFTPEIGGVLTVNREKEEISIDLFSDGEPLSQQARVSIHESFLGKTDVLLSGQTDAKGGHTWKFSEISHQPHRHEAVYMIILEMD